MMAVRAASRPNQQRARIGALALALLMSTLVWSWAMSSPASASAFRYWSYWLGSTGTWQSASTGPGDYKIVDADVQGWRFAVTSDLPDTQPDNAPNFAALCPTMTPINGKLRVAVVLDSGFAAHAPKGQTPPADVVRCVLVPDGSTGNQALAAAAAVESNDGLVCAIGGYPSNECGAEVATRDMKKAASAAAGEAPNPAPSGQVVMPPDAPIKSAPPSGFIFGLSALAILAGLVVLILRRRASVAANDFDQTRT